MPKMVPVESELLEELDEFDESIALSGDEPEQEREDATTPPEARR